MKKYKNKYIELKKENISLNNQIINADQKIKKIINLIFAIYFSYNIIFNFESKHFFYKKNKNIFIFYIINSF